MMKNTFCHPSIPSEFFSIGGNDDFGVANLEPPSVVDTTKMDLHSSGYYFHSPRSFSADNNWRRGVGDSLDFSDQHILGLRPGSQYPTSSRSIPHLPVKKQPIPPSADAMVKPRKRVIEAEDRRISGELSGSGDRKKNKRKTAGSPPCSSQCRPELGQLGLPFRRSQKISDKITALQKLVSPYGKTDTASVLQEASLYIKLLQDQIQTLLQMLANSYASIGGMHPQLDPAHHTRGETSGHGRRGDLRSRGLCVVPISAVHEVATKDRISYATMYY